MCVHRLSYSPNSSFVHFFHSIKKRTKKILPKRCFHPPLEIMVITSKARQASLLLLQHDSQFPPRHAPPFEPANALGVSTMLFPLSNIFLRAKCINKRKSTCPTYPNDFNVRHLTLSFFSCNLFSLLKICLAIL